jgi:hypothetical protein
MTTWLLCDRDGSVLSSCETYRMTSVSAGSTGSTHAVASVFTEPRLRGGGHASTLIAHLIPELLRRDPTSQASILYSDVGAALYQRCGFEPRPSWDRILPPERGPCDENIDQLLNEDAIAGVLAGLPMPRSPFFVWPSAAQVDWHLERERTYADALEKPRPGACGARVGGSAVFWTADFLRRELVILLAYAEEPMAAESLALAARRMAYRAGLARVRWWECAPDAGFGQEFPGGVRQARKGELPMLNPLSLEVRADHWTWISKALWV